PVQLWFDDRTHLLDRTVRTMPISTLTVRYGDYRRVAGVQLPFIIESRDSSTSDVETIHVDRWTLTAQFDERTFTAPEPPDDCTLEHETTVPLDIDGLVVVSAKLNGRAFDFILDTGGHNIVTPAVAEMMGLTPVVQAVWARKDGLAARLKRGVETVSYGAGGASRNWASRIDSLEIGGTVLKRPIVRYAEDTAGAFSSRTEAANIGTDVLANFVLDFDYASGVIGFSYEPGFIPLPF